MYAGKHIHLLGTMNMTRTILIATLLFCFKSQAQNVIIDSCGVNDSAKLNQYEVIYFNSALDSTQLFDGFTFNDKNVLFLNGNYGAMIKSKSEFFEQFGKPWFEKEDFPQLQIIILTDKEKAELKNYDAIVVSWSKIPLSERNRDKFLENGKKEVLKTTNIYGLKTK